MVFYSCLPGTKTTAGLGLKNKRGAALTISLFLQPFGQRRGWNHYLREKLMWRALNH